MIKTLGRVEGNDKRFDQPDISKYHAKITSLNNGNFLVEDLNSTNGTFINGYRIEKQATVTLHDEVRLSESTIVNLSDLFELPKQNAEILKANPKDFIKEFAALKAVWDNYQKERVAIQKKHIQKTTLIRSGITLAPLLIFGVVNALNIAFLKDKYLVLSVLGSTIAMYATGNMSPIEILTQMDEEFRVKYVCPCPTCRAQLGNVPWQSYYNQGKCFRCGAIYNSNNI